MFPYPSGAGLHVGHPLGYIGTDSYGRYQRMAGRNVLHAMGFDAFGLPAEQYAVQTGQHPRKTTEANVVVFRRQLRRLGFAYDDRQVGGDNRHRVLPVDTVDIPADLQLLVRPGAAPGPSDRGTGRGVRVRSAGRPPTGGRGRNCPPWSDGRSWTTIAWRTSARRR